MLKQDMVENSQSRSKHPHSAKELTRKLWIPLNRKSSQDGGCIMALLSLELFKRLHPDIFSHQTQFGSRSSATEM